MRTLNPALNPIITMPDIITRIWYVKKIGSVEMWTVPVTWSSDWPVFWICNLLSPSAKWNHCKETSFLWDASGICKPSPGEDNLISNWSPVIVILCSECSGAVN